MSNSLWPHGLAGQAPLSFTISRSLLKLMSIEFVMPSNHLILYHPSFRPASIFPSIRVSSNESALRVSWLKHWSFSFSISPSKEYSGLISFQTFDWFDLAIQGTLKSLLQHHSALKCQFLCRFSLRHSPSHFRPPPWVNLSSYVESETPVYWQPLNHLQPALSRAPHLPWRSVYPLGTPAGWVTGLSTSAHPPSCPPSIPSSTTHHQLLSILCPEFWGLCTSLCPSQHHLCLPPSCLTWNSSGLPDQTPVSSSGESRHKSLCVLIHSVLSNSFRPCGQ